MDELPVEVDQHGRDMVVAVGPRHKGALLLFGVALAVVAAVVAVGINRSPRHPSTVPATPPALSTVSTPGSTSTSAAGTSTSLPTVTPQPTLAGYRLVLLANTGTVFNVDLATGGAPTTVRVSGAGAGYVRAVTSKAFIAETAAGVVLIRLDGGARVDLGLGAIIDVNSEFILTADVVTGHYTLFGPSGEAKGTIAVPPSFVVVALSGHSVIVTGGGQIYQLPFDPNGVSGRDASQGPARSVAVGEFLGAGGGQIAYVACTPGFDCRIRFRTVTGGPEVTSLVYDRRMGPVGFTPDGTLFLAWEPFGDLLGMIAIEASTGRVHEVVPADNLVLRPEAIGRATSDGRYFVWRSSDGTALFYAQLPDGRHSGTIKLPESGIVDATLVPKP